MNLYRLLTIHGIITLAAALVLILAPSLIPGTVNIKMHKDQYLLCYFLSAAEFSLAYLSFYGRKLKDLSAIRVIIMAIIIFHGATFVFELYAQSTGMTNTILINAAARVFIVILLYYYGIKKIQSKNLR